MTAHPLAKALGRLARGLVGLTALVTLLAGIPWGLWHWVGWPLPHTIPTWADVSAALTRNGVPDELVINALAIVVWIAWADLCLAVALETAALVRGREAFRLPLAGPLQPLAAYLVTTAMLLVPQGGLRASVLSPAPIAVVCSIQQSATAQQPPAAAEKPSQLLDTRHPSAPPATTPSGSPTLHLPPLRYTVRAADPARGVKRDTLWGIAERFLGDGRRYPEIYRLNKGRPQPDGGRLTDPDRIWPGWVLDLPADAADRLATPTTPPAPQRSTPPAPTSPEPDQPPDTTPRREGPRSTATQPTTTTRHRSQPPARPAEPRRPRRPAIELPGGGVVGPSLAAAIAAALALAFLHRRRRYHPTTPRPGLRHPDPLLTPTIRRLLRATTGADQIDAHGEATVANPTIHARGNGTATAPPPAAVIPVAQDEDSEASIDLAAGGVGLLGPSGPAAMRAIISILLAHARPDTVEVLVAGTPLAAELLGPTALLPGLTITDDLEAALNTLEVELLRRSRLLAQQDLADVAAYAAFDRRAAPDPGPGRRRPQATVPATPGGGAGGRTAAWHHRRAARHQPSRPHHHRRPGRHDHQRPTRQGHCRAGGRPPVHAAPRGDRRAASRDRRRQRRRAAHHRTTLATTPGTGGPGAGDPAGPHRPAGHRPIYQPTSTRAPRPTEAAASRQVEVQLLGSLRIHVDGRQLSKGLRTKALELLAYLLVHSTGVTRDAGIEALWPELDPDRGVAWFKAVLGNFRQVLRPAELGDASVIARVVDRYQANADLIGCDLWRFQHALSTSTNTSDPAAKTAALQQALAAYQGDLVEGADYDWALTEREDLRRQAITAASRLANLHQQTGDHHRALDVLEQAIRWDPYNEELYQQIMRIQAQLGHLEEIRRTYRRLELRMADLDDDPSEPTHQLRDKLLHMARSRDHAGGQ
jgi:DNA-binding SARP family transcriptional activator